MTGFIGKSVIVTGAASGIGQAAALLFAEAGARVLAADIGDGVAATAAAHPAIAAAICDAGSEQEMAALVARAATLHGGVDIMVANAGVSGGAAGLFDQGEQDWADILRVNLIGPFLSIKYAAQAMVAAGRAGAIVCTASVAGLRAGAGGAAYSASKAGVINLVQSAAQQLAGSGIRVNAVCPGIVETGMTRIIYDRAREKGKTDQIGRLNPLRRGGEPTEIARAIAFLASDAASYINGQALAVDGGLSSSLPFSRPPELGKPAF